MMSRCERNCIAGSGAGDVVGEDYVAASAEKRKVVVGVNGVERVALLGTRRELPASLREKLGPSVLATAAALPRHTP